LKDKKSKVKDGKDIDICQAYNPKDDIDVVISDVDVLEDKEENYKH